LYLDLLERGQVDNHDKYTTILRHETERLRKLIVGFLEISGLDTAVDLPILEPLEVNSIVIDVVKQNESVILSSALTVDYQVASDLPLAMANKSLLERALFHLINNATLYAPDNNHISVLTAVQTQQNKEWVTIAVNDTGLGISAKEQSVLFDRFYRGEAATRTVTPGAGLGLAFCKESLEKQGGFITVASDPETGVTFTIWLKKAANNRSLSS
ncbi:MAG: hypothetical protein GWP17_04970, partial [Aquificales bacterium]|nr:hypothetical protein [Aquificales bacterium]